MSDDVEKGVDKGSTESSEVSDMIGDIMEAIVSPKEEKEDIKEDVKKEEKEANDDDSKEKEGEGEVLEEDKEEEKKDKEEDEIVDDKDEVIRQLREQIAELTGIQEIKKDGEEHKIESIKIDDIPTEDFFESDEEYDKAFEDRKIMSNVLKRVHVKAVESTMRAIPQIVDNIVRNQVIVYSKAADFFKRNPTLRQYSQFISKVANDISAKEPSLTLDDIFGNDEKEGKLAIEAKKRLALKDSAIKKEEKKERERPAFVKGGGARVKAEVKPVLQGIEKEIADLL